MVIYNAEVDKTQDIKPEIPDFVIKTKAYIKEHPEMIREIAGDEIQKLEAYLNTFPMGTGEIFKAKLNEFLGAPGTIPSVQQGTVNAPGQEDTGLDGQGQGNEPENEPEDFMTTQDVKDLVEYMAELSEQGLALPEIADAVWRDYRIEYHPLKIKRMLKAYYSKPDDVDDDGDKEPASKSLRVYQKLLERNAELQKQISEMSKAPVIPQVIPQIPTVPIRKGGLFGRLLRYLFWD